MSEMSTMEYIPFTYLIGWSHLNKWYYGVRVKPNTTPDDLWKVYFTSSHLVKQYRSLYGEPDVIKIRRLFSNKQSALLWEHKVLRRLHVKKQIKWLNISYGYGDTHSVTQTDTSKEKISRTRTERLKTGQIRPAKHTEEHKQKLRENNPGGKATSQPIYQIDVKTGEVVQEWESSRQAGISLGIKGWRNISHSANQLKNQTVGGYFWRWVGNHNIIDNVLVTIDEINTIRLDNAHRAGKQVLQIDDANNVVKTWKNMSEVGREMGLSSSTICAAIKANRKCIGFYWKKS